MPHKKNPDIFELIRAKCNKIQALHGQLAMITTNLPSGYHRDFQILKSPVISATEEMIDIVEIFEYSIKKIRINPLDPESDSYSVLFTVDSINELVKQGMPFGHQRFHLLNDASLIVLLLRMLHRIGIWQRCGALACCGELCI